MAHPYKQKYNNFNGPGHQSPANNIVRGGFELIKQGLKYGKNLFKRTPKTPKFVPVDSPKSWKKIQEKIAKRYVNLDPSSENFGKFKKFNVATDFVGLPIYGYQVTEGEDKRKADEMYEIEKDNPAFNSSTRDVNKTIDHFKRGDLD